MNRNEKTSLSWKVYKKNDQPGGERAPSYHSDRDDHSDALKGQKGPSQYLRDMQAQSSGCSSSKKK